MSRSGCRGEILLYSLFAHYANFLCLCLFVGQHKATAVVDCCRLDHACSNKPSTEMSFISLQVG